MGVAERRERERQEVRRLILDAARELFMREGYERVTMRAIADAIEYSPTTIYNHFEDKDALVHALCGEEFGQLLSAVASQDLPKDPVEAIRQLGLAYAAFGVANPNHYRFMFMTRVGRHEPSEQGVQTYDMLRVLVEKAIGSGDFLDLGVDVVSQVLWSSIHGAVALLITYEPDQFPRDPAVKDLASQVIDNAIRGLRTRKAEGR